MSTVWRYFMILNLSLIPVKRFSDKALPSKLFAKNDWFKGKGSPTLCENSSNLNKWVELFSVKNMDDILSLIKQVENLIATELRYIPRQNLYNYLNYIYILALTQLTGRYIIPYLIIQNLVTSVFQVESLIKIRKSQSQQEHPLCVNCKSSWRVYISAAIVWL